MKILYIEDSMENIFIVEEILKGKLNLTIDTSTYLNHFRNNFLEKINDYDVIICDHYFPHNKKSPALGSGHIVSNEITSKSFKGHFIHFSSAPCPELYQEYLNNDINFYSIRKGSNDCFKELVEIIKDLT